MQRLTEMQAFLDANSGEQRGYGLWVVLIKRVKI